MLVESTRSQNAVGLRRANALRVLLMFGSAPSRPSPRVASLRDFCSASCCARSTRMDHAMSERHTAVVSEPPMFVMCIAQARRGERGNGDERARRRPRASPPPEDLISRKRRGGDEMVGERSRVLLSRL